MGNGKEDTPAGALSSFPISHLHSPICDLLFLIGYRGTGKSTVGPLVAARLGWHFLDADALLEERHGQSIREMFAAVGEAGFRDREAELLAELAGLRRHVVATGGGVVLRPGNRELLRRGRIAWLAADTDTICRRLAGDPNTADRRPTLTVGGRAEVEQLLAVREPLYRECADVTVDTAVLSPAAAADAILAGWTSPSS
jgi:shikimate kinase